MSIPELTAVITAVASLLAALASVVAVISSLRNSRKISQVYHATNGMKSELIKVTGEAKFAEGMAQGEANIRNGQP